MQEKAIVESNHTVDKQAAGLMHSTGPICHFDIKPENVLIGSLDQGQHQRIEAFKLADFGRSMFEANEADRQTDEWKSGTQWRATPEWMSPVSSSLPTPVQNTTSRISGTILWTCGRYTFS